MTSSGFYMKNKGKDVQTVDEDGQYSTQDQDDECPDLFTGSPMLTVPSMSPKFITREMSNPIPRKSPPQETAVSKPWPAVYELDEMSSDVKACYKVTKNRSSILHDFDPIILDEKPSTETSKGNIMKMNFNQDAYSRGTRRVPKIHLRRGNSSLSDSDLDTPVIYQDGKKFTMVCNKHFFD